MKYLGFLKPKVYSELRAFFESEVYKHWDSDSSLSPPKTRPGPPTERRIDVAGLGLEVSAMQNQQPVFPTDVLLGRFKQGSPEQDKIKKLKEEFEALFPAAAEPTQRNVDRRVGGQCDFSIENGARPIDVSDILDVRCMPVAEAPSERLDTKRKTRAQKQTSNVAYLVSFAVRLGVLIGKQGRPIWLLNTTTDEMTVAAGELFGLGTGQFTNVVDSAWGYHNLALECFSLALSFRLSVQPC